MTETPNTNSDSLLMDATMELNCILLAGTSSERLMRLYALREIVAHASPEALLQIAADLAKAAELGRDVKDEQRQAA
jgi:hypothetical protein